MPSGRLACLRAGLRLQMSWDCSLILVQMNLIESYLLYIKSDVFSNKKNVVICLYLRLGLLLIVGFSNAKLGYMFILAIYETMQLFELKY